MAFQYLSNSALGQARENYIARLVQCGFSEETETVKVQDACGRITAAPVYARSCAPHYAASAMDGVAIAAEDSFGACETAPVVLGEDKFTVVDTGDPVPEGCSAVVMIEDVVKNADGSIKLYGPAVPWQHIRQIGEDICAGEMILPSFEEVSPSAIGALIAGGVLEIQVIKKPVVGIIPTGDELVKPCTKPEEGEILEFNSSIFASMVRAWGAEAKVFPIVRDDFTEIKNCLSKALEECSMVILNAGSSAGRDDCSAAVIESVGEIVCHGLAIKPGKPAILGLRGNKPVLGVPGYPVSGIIVIEEILKPLIEKWFHRERESKKYAQAVLTKSLVSGFKYQEFIRTRLGYVGDRLMAAPLNRGSGVVSSFMKADGILEMPQGTEGYEAGEQVSVRLLKPEERLKNTIVVIGSHDPLIDELAEIIHRQNEKIYLSSSHAGSMGGIMAIRRGEAHLGGCHLLDTETELYNLSYMRRYFPNRDVKLVRCVGRQQGLMTGRGNPLKINGFEDIVKGRYVNRQKGSGTRILADYLREKAGLTAENIKGWEREELTHTSVAAQIAGGSADFGLGIYSAAKLYDLDFLPVCIEEYDLIIPDYAWDTEIIKSLIAALKSDAFRDRITDMGGYTLENPGEIIPY